VKVDIRGGNGVEYSMTHLNDEMEKIMFAEIFGMDGIVVLIVAVALLFGDTAIPKLARSLGSAKNEFEKGLSESKPAEPARHVVDSQ
jgi:hypothetical protein